jgi:hypothetical protein
MTASVTMEEDPGCWGLPKVGIFADPLDIKNLRVNLASSSHTPQIVVLLAPSACELSCHGGPLSRSSLGLELAMKVDLSLTSLLMELDGAENFTCNRGLYTLRLTSPQLITNAYLG